MNAPDFLVALPAAPVAAGLIYLAGWRRPRSRRVALGWLLLSLPALAVATYRLWDHYVGPGVYAVWRFALSPANMPFLLPLAGVCPLLFLAAEGGARRAGRRNAASALSCFALAAALAAILSDHLFPLAGLCGLATLCTAGSVLAGGREGRHLVPAFLLPLGLADLCLALAMAFMYFSDPSRGLFFPAIPLKTGGWLAAACALMLASALLRLGGFPLHRWMAGAARAGTEARLLHVLALNLALGSYLLYLVTRRFFHWEGAWVWVCFGIAACTLLAVLRELLSARDGIEIWGLLCAALGAQLALCASPGGQAASAALRLGLWAGVPALALLSIGSEGGGSRAWAGILGAASILGLPPLAGFAWYWMGFRVLAGESGSGVTVIFTAALPLLFAGALVGGFSALRISGEGRGGAQSPASGAAGVLLASFVAAVGLYSGKWVDLLMREYGLPVNLPFPSWSTLGWAVLICAAASVAVLAALTLRGRKGVHAEASAQGALPPLRGGGRALGVPLPAAGKAARFLAAVDAVLYAGWAAALVYMAFK